MANAALLLATGIMVQAREHQIGMIATENISSLKAVPTEYKGVVFRSKCEAIFCRALELKGYLWEYEPKRFGSVDGWVPDFWIVGKGSTSTVIISHLIEYKPAEVTETYKRKSWDRFLELGDAALGAWPMLVCGSPFNHIRQTYLRGEMGWSEHEDKKNMFRYIDEAARFRFDLKQ